MASSPSTFDTPSRGRFLRLPEVKAETGLSRATIYRLESQGEFPSRDHLSARAVGWWSIDIDNWKASRRRAARRG